MLFALQRHRRRLGGGDPQVDRGEVFAHALDRGALLVGALAQLLDLALGRQDALRFGPHAALDDVSAAEDVAVERDHGAGDQPCGVASRVEVGRHPGVRENGFDDVGHGTRNADEIGQRREPWRRVNRGRRGLLGTPSATTKPTRPALRSRASRRPAAAWACEATTTCWSDSPREASTARS